MSQEHKIQAQCDSITGLCKLPDFEDSDKDSRAQRVESKE